MLIRTPYHISEPSSARQYNAQQETVPDFIITSAELPDLTNEPASRSNSLLFKRRLSGELLSDQPALNTDISDKPEQAMLEAVEASQPITEQLPTSTRKQKIIRLIIGAALFALIVAIYSIWNVSLPSAASQKDSAVQLNSNTDKTIAAGIPPASTSSTIQVYILGAVKVPGIYILPANARIYELLQKAGGPRNDANLVSINLAARLSDGAEVYIARVGEPIASYSSNVSADSSNNSGSLININTASASALRQSLHLSSASAAAIVNYRLQHGPYTSVDQLANVVSTSIFNKIKNLVTVG